MINLIKFSLKFETRTIKKETAQGKSFFVSFKSYTESYDKKVPGKKVLKKTEKSLRIYCSRLYQKERKGFFDKLNPSFVTDNKLFLKKFNHFFLTKMIMAPILN